MWERCCRFGLLSVEVFDAEELELELFESEVFELELDEEELEVLSGVLSVVFDESSCLLESSLAEESELVSFDELESLLESLESSEELTAVVPVSSAREGLEKKVSAYKNGLKTIRKINATKSEKFKVFSSFFFSFLRSIPIIVFF